MSLFAVLVLALVLDSYPLLDVHSYVVVVVVVVVVSSLFFPMHIPPATWL